MKKYLYRGPVSSVTLNLGDDRTLDVNFHPGQTVEVPEMNSYIRRLVRKGFLTPLAEEGAAKSKKAEAA